MRRRNRRVSAHGMLGDGISFEEVLTVITVLLLLRVVFMVPMVNLDKAKTVTATLDTYWGRAAAHLLATAEHDPDARPYRAALGLRDEAAVTLSRDGGVVLLEAAWPDSSLLVLRHEPSTLAFTLMRVQAGGARSFRRGRLVWSNAEREWFIGADTLDYGAHPSSGALEQSYRGFTKRERGF